MLKYIKNKLNLGLIYEDGHIAYHRTILKITLNPILRKFGIVITSVIDDRGKFIKYVIKRNKSSK